MTGSRQDITINGIISGGLITPKGDIKYEGSQDMTKELMQNLKDNNQYDVFPVIDGGFDDQLEVAFSTSGNDTIIVYKTNTSKSENKYNFFLVWRSSKRLGELIAMINDELNKHFKKSGIFRMKRISVNPESQLHLYCVDKSGTTVDIKLTNTTYIKKISNNKVVTILMYLFLISIAITFNILINSELTFQILWIIIGIVIPKAIDYINDNWIKDNNKVNSNVIDLEDLKFAVEPIESPTDTNSRNKLQTMKIEGE